MAHRIYQISHISLLFFIQTNKGHTDDCHDTLRPNLLQRRSITALWVQNIPSFSPLWLNCKWMLLLMGFLLFFKHQILYDRIAKLYPNWLWPMTFFTDLQLITWPKPVHTVAHITCNGPHLCLIEKWHLYHFFWTYSNC